MPGISNLQVDQFFRTTLTTLVTNPGVNSTITVADGSGFPDVSSPQYFYLTLVTGDTAEVVTVVDRTGNVLTTDAPVSYQFPSGTRAEHWFTAQAFQDITDYLLTLETTTVLPPDTSTIFNNNGNLSVKKINNTHIDDGSIWATHIQPLQVKHEAIGLSEVKDVNIVTVDAAKVVQTGTDPNKTKLNRPLLDESAERSDLAEPLTGLYTFKHIKYKEHTGPTPPTIVEVGDIAIEFESVT